MPRRPVRPPLQGLRIRLLNTFGGVRSMVSPCTCHRRMRAVSFAAAAVVVLGAFLPGTAMAASPVPGAERFHADCGGNRDALDK
jgi:hypothetical protein